MYRYAEQHNAFYCPENAKAIWYDDGSNDLQIAVVFETEALAKDFQTFLTQLYLDNPTVQQGDIDVRAMIVVYVAKRQYVLLAHYDGWEYEFPVASLESFTSIRSLSPASTLSLISSTDPLVRCRSCCLS